VRLYKCDICGRTVTPDEFIKERWRTLELRGAFGCSIELDFDICPECAKYPLKVMEEVTKRFVKEVMENARRI